MKLGTVWPAASLCDAVLAFCNGLPILYGGLLAHCELQQVSGTSLPFGPVLLSLCDCLLAAACPV